MLSDKRIFRPRSDVRFRVVGNEAVVVLQDAAEVIALNDMGGCLLTLLDSGRSVDALVEALSAEYDVDGETLRRDVESFLAELREAGVVEEVEAP
ncbi:MAG: PqqD family protein [Vicinamibacteria bacterium]